MKWGELAAPREDNWRKIPISLTAANCKNFTQLNFTPSAQQI
jgi:hypothetical protein